MIYKAINTDLKKLQTAIARRQRWCDEEVQNQNPDMARMYKQDLKDLTNILNLIETGKPKLACNIIDYLDTAVRDDIPPRLYNFIAKQNGYC